MKQPGGWRLVMTGGLACVAAVLASLFVISQTRQAAPPRVRVTAPPGKSVGPAVPDGLPVRIAPDDLALAGRERKDNGLGMVFCWCPPGTFSLGDVPRRPGQPRAATPVEVSIRQGFWMGKFEVTQAQWARVIGATLREQRAKDPKQPRPVGDDTNRDHVGEGPDHPIYYTSHADAEEFCRRLTESERGAGRLEPGWEYRLPAEAQWEFACRAGTTTTTAFGDRLSGTQANFDGSKPFNGAAAGPYLHETTPVGRYPANAWGLHDMHGNVWEWCLDVYAPLPGEATGPADRPSPSRRTYRGGCWHNPGWLCLSTTRGWGEVDTRGSGLGFRVALVSTVP